MRILGTLGSLLIRNDSESEALRQLSAAECVYTTEYDGLMDTGDDNKNCEYRLMPRACHGILPGIRSQDSGDDAVVVELEYLYSSKNFVGSKSPGKWVDYVIFYATEKRDLRIDDDDVFLGVAIYSHFYGIHGDYLMTLIDNLLRLYIEPSILDGRTDIHYDINYTTDNKRGDGPELSFYSRIYNSPNLVDEQQLKLLETAMKRTFLVVIELLGISFRTMGDDLNLDAFDNYLIGEWCAREAESQAADSSMPADFKDVVMAADFKNVIMERLPIRHDAKDAGYVLLTLIGMIRSGKHVISTRCRNWVDDNDLRKIVGLVNTNKSLAGITELGDSKSDLSKLVDDGIRGQLRYVEMHVVNYAGSKNAVIDFIDSLGDVEIKIDVNFPEPLILCSLLNSIAPLISEEPRPWAAKRIKITRAEKRIRLTIIHGSRYLADPTAMEAIANNELVSGFELFGCNMSLETFLIESKSKSDNFKRKLKGLSVHGIGDLSSCIAELGDAETAVNVLSGLESLNVSIEQTDDAEKLGQLADTCAITGEGFKWLILSDICKEHMPRVVELRNRLRSTGPSILTFIEPIGIEKDEYSCSNKQSIYIIHPFN